MKKRAMRALWSTVSAKMTDSHVVSLTRIGCAPYPEALRAEGSPTAGGTGPQLVLALGMGPGAPLVQKRLHKP